MSAMEFPLCPGPNSSSELASASTPQQDPLIPTVFHNDWWLAAATGGDYHTALLRRDNKVVACFPYVSERKFAGYRLCTMPELTHFLGPAIIRSPGSAINQDLKGFSQTLKLLEQVADFGGFYHKLHGGITDVLAFQDAGYTASVQFNYLIPPRPEREIWKGMRDKTRNVIRRAAERWQVTDINDVDRFASLYEENLARRGLVSYYKRIRPIAAAAIAHGQGRILAVMDDNGAIQGAVLMVWDHHVAYYLLATRTPGSDNGVMSLLVWHAIRDATAAGLTFDFDGVNTAGSRLFFAGFGGHVVPRYIVSKYSLPYRIAGQISKYKAALSAQLQPGGAPRPTIAPGLRRSAMTEWAG